MNASAAIADPLLRQACPRASERAGGRARRSVGHRIVHPLHGAEQRVPDTPPPRGGAPGTHCASLQWVQRDAAARFRDEPS
jgi:hypothetical protein